MKRIATFVEDRSGPSVGSALRLTIVGIVIASLFVALFSRLVFLQVVESPKLIAAAQANQIRTLYDEAPRGRILDRNGVVIVGNREVDVITVERGSVRADPGLLDRLAPIVGVDAATLRSRLADPKASPYRPVPVLRDADKELVTVLRERHVEFPGVTARTQIERFYPSGNLAAHVVGYLGEVNDKELEARREDGYRLGDSIGKSGIEAALEDELRGRVGYDKIEVDSLGRPVRVLERSPSVPGSDVQLTIDVNVQQAAEEALAEGLDAVKQTTTSSPPRGGSTVAVDPRSGEILAMASYPSYDIAAFNQGIRSADYAALVDPNGPLPLTNRAVSGQYAPGSTFKLITSIAALKTNLISASTTVNDGGAFFLGGRRYQNAQGRAYGPVDIRDAMTVSSDVYFYQLGARFWEGRRNLGNPIQATARDFGFGTKLGVPIAGETAGRVPDPDSRRKLHQERPDVYPEGNWYGGDNVNLAIGQGDMLVTPLQLASAYATFANGGELRLPRLVKRISDPGGRVLRQSSPATLRRVDLPGPVKGAVEAGIIGAVAEPRGTAYAAFTGFDKRAFPVAGKTGTAQVNGKQDNALFAGYGPVGDPQVAVSVVMEEAGFGGVVAAPVGRKVIAAVAGQASEPVRLGSSVD